MVMKIDWVDHALTSGWLVGRLWADIFARWKRAVGWVDVMYLNGNDGSPEGQMPREQLYSCQREAEHHSIWRTVVTGQSFP